MNSMIRGRRLTTVAGWIGMLGFWLAVGVRADDTAQRLSALVDSKAPSVVSIRAVIKTEMNFGGRSQDQESRAEMQGVVVDATGLILTSSGPLSPRLPGLPDDFDFKVTPVDLKVVIQGEEEEYEAFLAAKDSKLGLAFLQIKEMKDLALTPVDFETSVGVEVGQEVFCVGRLGKGYDYAPFFTSARVSGKVKKPRRALVHSGSIHSLGLPVFNLEGGLVGVVTTLESGLSAEEDEGGRSRGLMRALMGRGGSGGDSFIVAARSVKGVIKQAKKKAEEVKAEMEEEEGAEGKKEEKTEED